MAVMDFDISNFKDIEFEFNSYSGVEGRKLTLLYSLDQGDNWSIHSTTNCNKTNLPGDSSLFKYNLRIVASELLRNRTIRFAIVGNSGSGDSTDSYLLLGVVINNYQNFKEKLDGPLCDADNDTKLVLAHRHANLTSDELNLLDTEQMENYLQSYADGYSYLLSYWDSGVMNVKVIYNDINKKEIAIVVIMAISFISLLGIVVAISGKKKANR